MPTSDLATDCAVNRFNESSFLGFPTIDGGDVYIKYTEIVAVHTDGACDDWCIVELSNGRCVSAAVSQSVVLKHLARLTDSKMPFKIAPAV